MLNHNRHLQYPLHERAKRAAETGQKSIPKSEKVGGKEKKALLNSAIK